MVQVRNGRHFCTYRVNTSIYRIDLMIVMLLNNFDTLNIF